MTLTRVTVSIVAMTGGAIADARIIKISPQFMAIATVCMLHGGIIFWHVEASDRF